MTQQDAYRFGTDTSFDESSVFVAPGELLSEYQLLEALLVPSANNIAWTLARWDSGSVARFVVKMNAWARELGMNSTHYAGPSGFNPASVSTPADQLKLAAVVMANPVFRSIVNMQSVNLPIAGVVSNYNPLLGIDGIVGVKSGFTPQANGCLVAAADTSVGGVQETAMAAAFGQPGWLPLRTAANADQALIDKLKASLETVHVIGKGAVVARMLVPWKSTPVLLHAGKEVSLVALPGMSVELSKSALLTHEGLTHEGVTHRKLEDIPTLHVGLGEQEYSLSLYDNHPLTAPSFLWRLNRFW
jgi:D-alanyl-D-alanine carboxypeptidase (penicillin-binding protein 5/6)